ncbi:MULTISPECIES: hypothetical protein [Actinomadura]|uniref:hypothetical protein n=1 Tax=Actinomadura TaxID=1988 RepID=UPI00040A7029|nr:MULTISPECIES: hypothetical protein [Actinomadura]RSN46752.1 hypothetical protein DMH08_35250 [Actinomadura sp. WAC 06369]
MNRSATGLLRARVLAPALAASAVLAAPAAAQAAPAPRPAPPAAGHHHAPTTEEHLLGRAGEVVKGLGRDLGTTEGRVVEVLKADDGAAKQPSGGAKPPVRGLR